MKTFLSLVFIFSIYGCASYQSKVAPAKNYLKNKNCPDALATLEKLSTPPSSDQLALLMEHGTALQICEKYEESNRVFSRAESLADEVDHVSISQVAGAALSNEGVIDYKGDTFEKLFLNAAKALNYIEEKKSDDALVEVRRMNQKFSKYKNEERKNHELNSFSKYLSGLIWESTGQYDDACIDYKDAYFTAQQFRDVGRQMLTTCWAAQRTDEFNTLAKKMTATDEEIKAAKNVKLKSELVFVFLQGWGPQKVENPAAPTFPMLVNVPNRTQTLSIEIYEPNKSTALGSYASLPIYSVADASRASLNADQASLIARRLASRAAKYVVADQIRQKNEVAGFLALAGMVLSEQADLRQWSFLPNAIQIIRIPVQPGKYTAKIKGQGFDGVATESFGDITLTVDKRQKAIHMIRSVL